MDKFTDELEKLTTQASSWSQIINEVSDKIRKLEKMLHHFKCNITFEYHIKEKSSSLLWDKCPPRKKFRLLLKEEQKIVTLIEAPMNTRLSYNKYLTDFIVKYRKYITKEELGKPNEVD